VPEPIVKKAEAKLTEATKLAETKPAEAVAKAAEAMREIEKPLTLPEVRQLSNKQLNAKLKEYGIDTAAMPTEPKRASREASLMRAMKRDAQYDRGETPPVDLETRQRTINKTLKTTKPMTPEQREQHAFKLGQAEGTLAGRIAGVREGALDERKAIAKAMREGKKTVDVLKSNLKDLAKNLNKDDRAALAVDIEKVRKFDGYEKVINKILTKLEGAERTSTISDLKDLYSAYRKKEFVPEAYEVAGKEMRDMLDKIGVSVEGKTDKDIAKDLYQATRTMDVAKLADLRDNLAILKAASDKQVQAKNEQVKAQQAERVTKAAAAAADAAAMKAFTLGARTEGRKTVVSYVASGTRRALMNLYTRLNMLDGGREDGEHNKLFRGGLRYATRTYDGVCNMVNDTIQKMNDIVPTGWGKKDTFIKATDGATGEQRYFDLTHNEKVSLYLLSLRDSTRKDLIEHGFQRENISKNVKLTKADIKELHKSMTDNELAIATLISDSIRNELTRIAREAHIKLNHYDIKNLEENFFRSLAIGDLMKQMGTRNIDEKTKSGKKYYSTEQVPWLKAKFGGKALVLTDAVNTYTTFGMQVGKYAGFAEPLRDINKLMNDERWQAAVRDKFGEDFIIELKEHVGVIEGKVGDRGDVETFLLGVLRNAASSYINMNPRTIPKQVPSAMNVLAEGIPAKYLTRNLTTVVPTAELFRNPTLQRRYREQMLDREIAEQYAAKGILQIVRRKAGIGIREGDRMAISRIYATVKDYLATEKGLKGDKLMDAAADKTVDIINRSQPTSDPMNQTLWQAEKGLVYKTPTLFSSFRSKMNNMVLQEITTVTNNPEDKKAWGKLGRVVGIYAANQAAMVGIDYAFRGWSKMLAGIYEKITGKSLGKTDSPEKAISVMGNLALRSVMGMIPTGREAWTVLQAFKTGTDLRQTFRTGQLDSALDSAMKDIGSGLYDFSLSDKELPERLGGLFIALDRLSGVGVTVPARYVKDIADIPALVEKIQDRNMTTMMKFLKDGDRTFEQAWDYVRFIELPKERHETFERRVTDWLFKEFRENRLTYEETESKIRAMGLSTDEQDAYLDRLDRSDMRKLQKENEE